MGLWDVVRKILGLLFRSSRSTRPSRHRSSRPSGSRAPAPPNPAEVALARRRNAQGLTRNGKPLSAYRLRNYEHLERQIAVKLGKFPWTREEARAALAQKGFDPAQAQAYLDSAAARKLLEG